MNNRNIFNIFATAPEDALHTRVYDHLVSMTDKLENNGIEALDKKELIDLLEDVRMIMIMLITKDVTK